MKFNFSKARAIFDLAGIDFDSSEELPNGYWPLAYQDLRKESPWFLFFTEFGPVKIGWRKRVLEISWERSKFSGIITDDDVTKDEKMVHAWNYGSAITYLENFREMASKC